ncbi:MAG TPA: hypothetical protein VGQ71_15220, partial [Terriglobales bacterium]|nr:hypothetical protein [Terriglobales bacterium]
ATTQLVGIGLGFYSTQFHVGIGGLRDFLWIPAVLLLLPGILLGYGIGTLDSLGKLAGWYGIAFFLAVVLINAVSWNALALVLRSRRRATRGY